MPLDWLVKHYNQHWAIFKESSLDENLAPNVHIFSRSVQLLQNFCRCGNAEDIRRY